MTEIRRTKLAIIGAGPGGYAAAFLAADLGIEVALIDVEPNPGGTCLYRGCIPSKALLHVAKIINDAKDAVHWGLKFAEPELELSRLRNSTQDVVNQMTGGLGQLCKTRKVQYIQGRATYLDSNTLEIFGENMHFHLQAEHTIIAAGSRPALFGPLIDSPRMMNSTTALQLPDIPQDMLVIGGGYIGLELGSVYARLGVKVTVVEMGGGLLPGADRDLVRPLHQRMESVFQEILLNTTVAELKEETDGMHVRLEGPNIEQAHRVFEKVLVCVGRKPNSSGLGLKATKVQLDPRGFIKVDAQRRTDDPAVFAVGDIVNGPMLAHKASHEGRVAAEVIAGRNVAFEPRAIPAVAFTDPEIAWCGLQESEAKASEQAVKVLRFPWAASGRAATLHREEGLTKLVCDPDTEQVLGVGIVGQGAGELIAEGALAIEMGAIARDLDLTIHAHPTLSETLMESAASFYGHSTHIHRPKKQK